MIQLLIKILFTATLLTAGSVFAKDLKNNSKDQATTEKNIEKKPQAKIGSVADGRKAAAALNEILRAYGSGDTNFIRDRLDSQMIGFQKLLDGVTTEANQCKQLKVRLVDTQIQAGPDIVVIQSGWEKRCLKLPNFSPQLFTGHSTFLLHNAAGGWTITAISGTNPLAPSLTTGR